MTAEEIKKVADIMSNADGGCSTCWAMLLIELNEAFPGYEKEINELWVSEGHQDMSWKEDP